MEAAILGPLLPSAFGGNIKDIFRKQACLRNGDATLVRISGAVWAFTLLSRLRKIDHSKQFQVLQDLVKIS